MRMGGGRRGKRERERARKVGGGWSASAASDRRSDQSLTTTTTTTTTKTTKTTTTTAATYVADGDDGADGDGDGDGAGSTRFFAFCSFSLLFALLPVWLPKHDDRSGRRKTFSCCGDEPIRSKKHARARVAGVASPSLNARFVFAAAGAAHQRQRTRQEWNLVCE